MSNKLITYIKNAQRGIQRHCSSMRSTVSSLVCAAMVLVLTGCDAFDCSLMNTVECKIGFYNGAGQPVIIQDTLSVFAQGTDSVLFNRGVRTKSIAIPLSHYQDVDVLTLRIWGKDYVREDELAIAKTNTEYFESLDCPVKMIHNITEVMSTNIMIDSVKITSPEVKLGNGENIKVYLHTFE